MVTDEFIQTLSIRASCTYTEEKACINSGIICMECLFHGCHYLKVHTLTNSADHKAETTAEYYGFLKVVMCRDCINPDMFCNRTNEEIKSCLDSSPTVKTALEGLSSKHP